VCVVYYLLMCDSSAIQLLGLVRLHSIAGEVFPVTSGEVAEDFPMWHPTPLK